MEKQLPGAGFRREYGEYYTMGDDSFLWCSEGIAIYRKTNVKKGCAQETNSTKQVIASMYLKSIKCYYIYICSKGKMEKLREKYGIRGYIYIYIYPDVFHAKLTQHLGAFISWKICDGINSHKI